MDGARHSGETSSDVVLVSMLRAFLRIRRSRAFSSTTNSVSESSSFGVGQGTTPTDFESSRKSPPGLMLFRLLLPALREARLRPKKTLQALKSRSLMKEWQNRPNPARLNKLSSIQFNKQALDCQRVKTSAAHLMAVCFPKCCLAYHHN